MIKFPAAGLLWCALGLVFSTWAAPRALAGDLKFEAQLVWGANEANGPHSQHKPVDEEVKKELQKLPLKWTNYFQINCQKLCVPAGGTNKVALSTHCQLEVRHSGGANVGVTLIGKGKEVMKRSQSLPKGEMLVLGGNAPGATSWLVILRRIE
jgi:hypothetical protein